MVMVKNVGQKDKMYRYAATLVFLALGIIVSWWFYVLAFIAFATATFRTCLLYKLFNINTNTDEEKVSH